MPVKFYVRKLAFSKTVRDEVCELKQCVLKQLQIFVWAQSSF